MPPFELYLAPRIVFGCGTLQKRLAELTAPFGNRVLVVTHPDRAGRASLFETVRAALPAALTLLRFDLAGEPVTGEVDRAAELARSEQASAVIGIGGGSAIDAAKAIAVLATNPGGALAYMEVIGRGEKLTRDGLPFIALPTTAGTGAEATRNAVLGSPEHRVKASLRHERMMARVALIDPELQRDVRPDVTARSGMDALTQCIEAFVTRNANPFTDALCRDGIRRALRSLPRAVAEGSDLAAREDMALAALFSGVALVGAGLGAVHGFAAPMGARFEAPHGALCARLLPPVLRVNAARANALPGDDPRRARWAELAALLTPEDPRIERGTELLAQLAEKLRIPRLRELGVAEDDFGATVAAAKRASSMKGNPFELSDEELTAVLREAL